jgi:hypothetical protein
MGRRRSGRKKLEAEDRRDIVVKACLLPSEFRKLEELAAKRDDSLSSTIRRFVLAGLFRREHAPAAEVGADRNRKSASSQILGQSLKKRP